MTANSLSVSPIDPRMSGTSSKMEKKISVRKGDCRLTRNCLISMYITLGLMSLAIFVIFTCTNIFRNAILSSLELRNGTSAFDYWQKPPINLLNRIYIFNYTNTEEFEAGKADKLVVKEVGPYIYREELLRVNPVFHENGTVTYQEKRIYKWEGGRSDNEFLIVPNVPLLSAIAFSRDIHFLAKVGVGAVLSTLMSKTFVNVTAGGFIWGYDDRIFEMARPFMSLKQELPDKFGLLAFKKGISTDRITIHTGVDDMQNLGEIQRLNGMEQRNVWGDKSCDEIGGTDGSMFPPHMIDDKNTTLYVYAKDLCRKMPLRYHSDVKDSYNGIPGLRYKFPLDVFTSTRTKDTCFCPTVESDAMNRRCPPPGILNISRCNFDSNLLTSFPHFYGGDKSLLEYVDGLNPRQEEHETYVDLHPRLGVPIRSKSRLQVNLDVRTAAGVPFSGKLKDGTILPLLWIEAGLGDIPDPVYNILRNAHFFANTVEAGAQWGGLVILLVSVFGILFLLRKHRNERHVTLQRNVSGQDKLLEQGE